MSPVGYSNMLEGKAEASRYRLRLELVRYAQEHGIRAAARDFRTSRNTVRLWLRRYEADGAGALQERSRAPRRIPHKTSRAQERAVVRARKQASCYGARSLKRMFELEPSAGAIARILREKKLTRKTRKKHEKKKDLRQVKAHLRVMRHWQMDTKYLTDIPAYWPQMQVHELPRFQYTLRDVKTGALFVSYGNEISLTYASMLAKRLLGHLERFGIDPKDVTIQTDRGGEFSGGARKKGRRGFVRAVETQGGAKHVYTPPHWPNANAEVESSHARIEAELFDLERFGSREQFRRKVTVYQHFFNYVRPNSYRGDRAPWDILQAEEPELSGAVLNLSPLLLEEAWIMNDSPRHQGVGQHVPVLPAPRNPVR